MAQDIREQLDELFAAPLSEYSPRHIVFWHDLTGEFSDAFSELAGDGTAELGGVSVRCVSVESQSVFGLKRTVTREQPGENFLLYTRRAKDDLNGDWLADVELYSEHFQSDATSLVLQELGANDTLEIRATVRRFSRFLRAKDRRAKLLRRVDGKLTADALTCGVLAVLLGAGDARPESIVLAFAELLADGTAEEVLSEVRKYEAQDALEALLQKACGYEGELGNASEFLSHLLLTAASPNLPAQVLSGLERFVSPRHANFCLTVVRAWMREVPNDRLALEQSSLCSVARQVEEGSGLPERFSHVSHSELEGCDVFPCIDTCILRSLVSSMAEGADRREEAREVFDARKNLKWYELKAVYYECLLAACDMQDFQREHGEGFHYAKPEDAWGAYTTDWWRMDAAYRRFRTAYQRSKLDLSDIDEEVDALAQWANNLYTNWFLADANRCWVQAAASSWEGQGNVAQLPSLDDFYRGYVRLDAAAGKKVVVIISDGMRYEVAQELADRLRGQIRGSVSVEALQGILPTETKFGMAALLPHESLKLEEPEGEVLVDGVPSGSTKARQGILAAESSGSLAIQYKDLQAMGRADRRSWAMDAPVVYVYHNAIDVSGHHEFSGQGVFESCEQALNEVASLTNIAIKDLGASRVLVTADHGFLYTALDLAEADKVGTNVVAGQVVKASSRYVMCQSGATSAALVPVNLQSLDNGTWAWLFARDCVRIKASGSKNYVHGGLSLQEYCVPVVRISTSGHTSSHKATIQLLGTSRRVTNSFFSLRFFQKEAVGGKVLPAEYELVMTDSSGVEVSDVRPAQANNPSQDENARKFKLQFALRPGFTFNSKETYHLVCRERGGGRVAWREEFSIDVSFAPLEDFGF